ncbi:MAG: hypothetical protein CL916_13310 [Deltaproteobacteria bacterium]|nr:hypothetical protein [Deltaproteobacteria bacterium]
MIRAQLYELLTHNITFDIPFYTQSLHSKSERILELGVGTGRTVAPLLTQGYSCTGIDNDPHMISFCTQKYKTLQLHSTNITKFSLDDRFHQIQAPLRVMHVLSQKERAGTLSCIKKHLLTSGHAIFHISSWKGTDLDGQWRLYSIIPSSDGGEILIEEAMYKDESHLHILHRFQQISPHHHVSSTHIKHTKLYPILDFMRELDEAGFLAQTLYQDTSNLFILANIK